MTVRSGITRAAGWGTVAGLGLGVLEAVERTAAHRAHLEGPGELLGHGLLVFATVWLATVSLAWMAGVGGGIAMAVGGRLRALPAAARLALLGAVLGLLAGFWIIFALTLTARLGRWLRYTHGILLAFAGAGALVSVVLPRLPRPSRALSLGTLLLITVVAYFLNSRFAPQSSYGIHVLLDTAQWLAAMGAAALLVPMPGRGLRLAAWAVLPLSLVVLDVGLRASPRLEALVKIRGVFARRSLDALANALDWDGDGFALRFVVHGWDDAPFDPRRPEPLLICDESSNAGRHAAGLESPGDPRQLNIVLLTIDALRDDVLPGAAANPLGALAPDMPHLESLQRESVTFARCYSHASGTEDTFSSLFAGANLPSLLCGVEEDAFLASRLRQAGYRTRAWCNGYPMPRRAWGWTEIDVREGETDAQIDSLLASLSPEGSDPAPAFVWMHLMDLHASVLKPWSPQAYDPTTQRRRYAAGLTEVDRVVGQLHQGLRERGLLRTTLVILTADHGEELGEHGHYHHNLTLYEPAVRVPLWMVGLTSAPGRREVTVPQQDVHATILDAAGLDREPSVGLSLLPSVEREDQLPPARAIYLFLPTRGFSREYTNVRPEQGQAAWITADGTRKVILRFDKETREAYDLRVDPGERWNLAGEEAAWIAAAEDSLRRRLEAWSR